MNERIKELTVEANDQTGNKFDLNHKPLDAFLGKFAELIVQECLTFIEPMPGSGDIDDLALEAACEGIKEHFGVEE